MERVVADEAGWDKAVADICGRGEMVQRGSSDEGLSSGRSLKPCFGSKHEEAM